MRNKILEITPFGENFLSHEYDLSDIFFSSFIKWQLPNPDNSGYKLADGYNIKPFIGILHLIRKVNEKSLVNAAAAVALKFCPATQYDVELFHPVCLDPKIQKYAKEWAEKAGVGVARLKNKDPEDDFCRLNEKGQDKCEAGLGVPRILMPSLDDPSSFLNRIHRQFHINYTEETAKMSSLIPAQGEIRQSRAEGAAKGMDPETGLVEVGKNKNGSPIYASPIIISQDNYIIDGHHRWAAAYKLGLEDRSIPVIRIHAPITSILMAGALEPTNPF